ncbi:MAG TPA: TonB family protein [Terriglobales bacterium]|nr:TonB family protein [Terriglobales bacterium]
MANRIATPQPSPSVRKENGARPQAQIPPSPELAEVAQSLQAHLQSLADEILLLARGDGVGIALTEHGELRCRAASGVAPPLGTRIDARSGLTGACLRTGTLLRCDDSEVDTRVDRQVCRALGIRAMVCVPVSAGNEVVGIFEIFSSQPNAFLNIDSAVLHAKAEEIANCFAAEEALARAAVASVADLGTTGDLAPSWTPGPPQERLLTRLHLSSRSWQAVLGVLVLTLGLFLLLRAIRASGPAASAWIAPQAASAAPRAVQPEEAATNRLAPPQRRARVRPVDVPFRQQTLIVASAAPARNAASGDSTTPPPPDALLAATGSTGAPLGELVSSVSAAQPSLPADLRVSTGIPQPVLIQRVEPVYPVLAKQSGIEGAVVLEALVNTSGQVYDLRVASGNSLLAAAALRAVRQWRYRPSRLNGKPVEVPIRITLNFELSK